ncbi:FKBP-type peptidyl-prolyl cis-trans isomerase [Paraflavisolibacter sp. H34]|uniref:FKBP-type peptidyl-prolyl cis-trans isomerase n=1 Tax=Huijunlia imazamoxiresistens TaxID=3127457 RepID=UPI003016209E
MRSVKFLFSAAAIAGIMSSCGNVDFKKTKGGMPYKLYPSKSGQKLAAGNFVKVNFTQKINDSVLFTTYDKSPVYFPVSAESQPYDISELIPTLKVGDSVYAVQLIDTFMKRNPGGIPPQFKKGDKLISTIKIEGVFKSQEEAQQDEAKERSAAFGRDTKVQGQLTKDIKAINDYLSKNNITANKTGNGTYVQVLTPGTGPKVEMGKFLKLRYKGTVMSNGKEFDSNMDGKKPTLDFVLAEGGMIKGFVEGLQPLSQGAKARLFIPSALGYGENAPPQIGPNENLIFDVEVLEVSAPPSTPNMAPSPTEDTTHAH